MTSVQSAGTSIGTGPPLDVALVGCVDDNDRAEDLDGLAAALGARGHTVTVYVRHQGEQTGRVLGGSGYRVQPVHLGPAAAVPTEDALALSGELAGQLQDAWGRTSPDVVHGYGWLPGVAAQLAARTHVLPTVQSFHGVADSRASDRGRLETVLARGATWVTAACSEELELLSRIRRNRARVSLVPVGVDADRFAFDGEAHDTGTDCRIACLAPNTSLRQDVSPVLKLLPALGGCRLVVGATGPAVRAEEDAWKPLQQLAADLGVAHLVTFLGTLDADAVAQVLRSVDVLASTPSASPDHTVVLAAMASGVAVVAYDVGALSDVVIHDVTGFLVPRNNQRALALALKALQSETFRRQGMGAAGRTRARSRYGWDRIAVDAESAYRQVARAPI